MSERMQAYRDRMKKNGFVQVRVWVEEQDEKFVKFIAKFCRDERKKKEKKRFGCPASITIAGVRQLSLPIFKMC